ncbi:MAG: 4-(cytidine 5'-diphospho)-2-C-methyl-D-erythritol kinase [Candidatus Omnitrophota bacterium]
MSHLTVRSPAKLNLFLKVHGRRPDGYHELRTLFERIDLCDELIFQPEASGRIRISCDDPQVPTGRKNLVYQVAEFLQRMTKSPQGIHIRINKRIPVAAGLAGGSSNAAGAIEGLNTFWQLGMSAEQKTEIGARIGSDINFFLKDTSWALGKGRGEQIHPLDMREKLWHVLVVPRVKMYSGEVFTALQAAPLKTEAGRADLKLTKEKDNANILIHSILQKNITRAQALIWNDLEPAILRVRPSLKNVKESLLKAGIAPVTFSGSGPSVFGCVVAEQQAKRLANVLRKRYSRVFAVRTL